jgi:Protein of unknown function (DUF2891)
VAEPLVLSPALASELVRVPLGHVTRAYPNKLDHILNGPDDLRSPRELHPAFYGSFDWHSCVHGYWLMARVLRRFPDLADSAAVRAVVDEHLTPDKIAGELRYLDGAGSGFERPYGWTWLLALAGELARHPSPEGRRWCAALAPLADAFSARFLGYLPKATYPIRAGTHGNGAFALALTLVAAEQRGDVILAARVRETARTWFGADRACQAWEPGGDDFLSPALVEAECMRRVLPPAEFGAWLDAFLPELGEGRPVTLFQPVTVSDRTDGRIAHLDGVNLSRGWCSRSLAAALDPSDPRRARLLANAETHLAASLPHVTGHYMGEHWLATFALLALDGDE